MYTFRVLFSYATYTITKLEHKPINCCICSSRARPLAMTTGYYSRTRILQYKNMSDIDHLEKHLVNCMNLQNIGFSLYRIRDEIRYSAKIPFSVCFITINSHRNNQYIRSWIQHIHRRLNYFLINHTSDTNVLL